MSVRRLGLFCLDFSNRFTIHRNNFNFLGENNLFACIFMTDLRDLCFFRGGDYLSLPLSSLSLLSTHLFSWLVLCFSALPSLFYILFQVLVRVIWDGNIEGSLSIFYERRTVNCWHCCPWLCCSLYIFLCRIFIFFKMISYWKLKKLFDLVLVTSLNLNPVSIFISLFAYLPRETRLVQH